jgi:hypothetical protein
MKKVIITLAVLIFAQTVQAVDISCTVDGYFCCGPPDQNDVRMVTISYSGAMAGPSPVRAFALDITLSGDRTFSEVTCLGHQFGYHIYPGSIRIDASGNVSDWGSCRCSGDYPGTLDDANAMTIEMASAYEPGVDPDPCDSGDLVSFRVEGPYAPHVSIDANPIRGGIVNEDASITTPSITECDICLCQPTCWDELLACGGQPLGDATCDGLINALDLFRLKQSWLKRYGDAGYNCCANFNHDAMGVNAIDLFILKQNWLTAGLLPATGTQDCPDPEW